MPAGKCAVVSSKLKSPIAYLEESYQAVRDSERVLVEERAKALSAKGPLAIGIPPSLITQPLQGCFQNLIHKPSWLWGVTGSLSTWHPNKKNESLNLPFIFLETAMKMMAFRS